MQLSDKRVYMNTVIHITFHGNLPTIKAQEMLESAFEAFNYVVRKYTRFEPTSELSKLNANQGKEFTVDQEFFDLVEKMLKISKQTNFAYDPTIIDLLELYGYKKDADYQELEDQQLFQKIKERVRIRPKPSDIILNPDNLTIKLNPDQRLDLGSIGKGFAMDLAADKLAESQGFMINAGGDILTKGQKQDGSKWIAGLYNSPRLNQAKPDQELLGTIELENQALAASGGWVRRRKFFHHLLSSTTGLPINEISQTFVLAPTAVEADAWATALFTIGENGLDIIEQENLEALIIRDNGTIIKTDNFNYQPTDY